MPSGEGKSDVKAFEAIASRLDNCRSRINNVTNALEKSVDIINGRDPDVKEDRKELKDSPGDSIISGLHILLIELETQLNDLEYEQNRLTKIFF